jgi:hypothetical protein
MKLPSILQLIRAPFLPSDPMARAKLCLDTLRADWETRHKAWKAGQIHSSFGDIDWHTYAKKYNLTEQQIFDYCETLPRLQLIHPHCPLCNQPWYDFTGDGLGDYMNKARPVSNGHVISWVDYVETFCVCQEDNNDDDIWYHQSKEGKCSFNRNINMNINMNNEHIELRWNCNCMEIDCRDKNVLVWHKYISRDNYDYIILKTFVDDDPILTAPREEVWEVAEKMMLLC